MRRLLGLILIAGAAQAADAPPAWLSEMATREIPAYEDPVQAVTLFEEEKATVGPDGSVVTTIRKAVKIVTRQGRSEAYAPVVYHSQGGKVERLDAWMIHPTGGHKTYGKKETIDRALSVDDVYNESRMRFISASDDADPGAVFGFEAVSRERSIFTQFSYLFQDENPALTARFTLELPSGWTAKAVTFQHEPIEPIVQGSTYTWELTHLPPIVDEPARPAVTALTPRISVSYFAPGEARTTMGPTFESWEQVSSWLATLSDPRSQADAAITAKAAELAGGAATAFDRIAAVGRYAQAIKYVSIQMGLSRGGGYEPHDAAEIFQRAYGDCKDKANLMRAMLRTLDIESYPLTVYSGDRSYVNGDWPSPRQFNHAIIAVRVGEDVEAPAVFEDEAHGRWLIFDPTDPITPPGELREGLQGSLGLLVRADGGPLIRLPETAPEENLLRREVEATLAPDGSLTAKLVEQGAGESARAARRLYEELPPSDYRNLMERWLTLAAPSAQLKQIASEHPEGGPSSLQLEFEAAGYGRAMGSKLLIFQPTVVSRRGFTYPEGEKRRYPFLIPSRAFDETVRVKLPEGFVIDEKPADVELDEAFGRYEARFEEADGELVFRRKLTLESSWAPPEEYETVRQFFGRINGAEQSPVVLMRR